MPNKASSSAGSRQNKVFVLQRAAGGPLDEAMGIPSPATALVGVYVSEEQAYAAVIQRQVAGMEQVAGSMLGELRKIVTAKGLSFKERYKKMCEWVRDCDWCRVPDCASFQIRECPLVPFEKVNESKLFHGVQDLQQSASDNGSYADDEDEDEVFDDSGKPGLKKRRF